MGFTTILGVLPLLLIIREEYSFSVSATISFFGGVIASVTGTNITTVILNVNYINLRGFVLAIFTLTDDIGRSLGGLGISGLIYALGREKAFTLATALGWSLCGIILASMSFTMLKDEETASGNMPLRIQGLSEKDAPPTIEFSKSIEKGEKVYSTSCVTGTQQNWN